MCTSGRPRVPLPSAAGIFFSTSMNTGKPAFGRVNGAPLFDYLGRHPDDAQVLDQAMTSMSETMQLLFLAAHDFGRFHRVVDVGGGRGALLAGVLLANPHLTGILCEAPPVLSRCSA